ncbi:hypothetical protein F4604DRAFT_1684793 [Suillus subluteus]|nr:hypothetical protein F4604DRAFT_1684793 [Suillus subluteus]
MTVARVQFHTKDPRYTSDNLSITIGPNEGGCHQRASLFKASRSDEGGRRGQACPLSERALGGAADDADILANHASFNFEFVITWLQRLGKLIGTDPHTLVHIVEPLLHNCLFLAILGDSRDHGRLWHRICPLRTLNCWKELKYTTVIIPRGISVDSRGDRIRLLSTCTFTAKRLLFMLTTVPRVITPGIKNPATDQLLLDGLLTGAMPDDHTGKLKIAVKCGDHSGGRFRLTVYLYGLRSLHKAPRVEKCFQCMKGRRWREIAKMTLAHSGTSFLRRGSSGGNPRTAFDPRLRGKFTGGY